MEHHRRRMHAAAPLTLLSSAAVTPQRLAEVRALIDSQLREAYERAIESGGADPLAEEAWRQEFAAILDQLDAIRLDDAAARRERAIVEQDRGAAVVIPSTPLPRATPTITPTEPDIFFTPRGSRPGITMPPPSVPKLPADQQVSINVAEALRVAGAPITTPNPDGMLKSLGIAEFMSLLAVPETLVLDGTGDGVLAVTEAILRPYLKLLDTEGEVNRNRAIGVALAIGGGAPDAGLLGLTARAIGQLFGGSADSIGLTRIMALLASAIIGAVRETSGVGGKSRFEADQFKFISVLDFALAKITLGKEFIDSSVAATTSAREQRAQHAKAVDDLLVKLGFNKKAPGDEFLTPTAPPNQLLLADLLPHTGLIAYGSEGADVTFSQAYREIFDGAYEEYENAKSLLAPIFPDIYDENGSFKDEFLQLVQLDRDELFAFFQAMVEEFKASQEPRLLNELDETDEKFLGGALSAAIEQIVRWGLPVRPTLDKRAFEINANVRFAAIAMLWLTSVRLESETKTSAGADESLYERLAKRPNYTDGRFLRSVAQRAVAKRVASRKAPTVVKSEADLDIVRDDLGKWVRERLEPKDAGLDRFAETLLELYEPAAGTAAERRAAAERRLADTRKGAGLTIVMPDEAPARRSDVHVREFVRTHTFEPKAAYDELLEQPDDADADGGGGGRELRRAIASDRAPDAPVRVWTRTSTFLRRRFIRIDGERERRVRDVIKLNNVRIFVVDGGWDSTLVRFAPPARMAVNARVLRRALDTNGLRLVEPLLRRPDALAPSLVAEALVSAAQRGHGELERALGAHLGAEHAAALWRELAAEHPDAAVRTLAAAKSAAFLGRGLSKEDERDVARGDLATLRATLDSKSFYNRKAWTEAVLGYASKYNPALVAEVRRDAAFSKALNLKATATADSRPGGVVRTAADSRPGGVGRTAADALPGALDRGAVAKSEGLVDFWQTSSSSVWELLTRANSREAARVSDFVAAVRANALAVERALADRDAAEKHTVFVPINGAFDTPAVRALLATASADELAALLGYHVVSSLRLALPDDLPPLVLDGRATLDETLLVATMAPATKIALRRAVDAQQRSLLIDGRRVAIVGVLRGANGTAYLVDAVLAPASAAAAAPTSASSDDESDETSSSSSSSSSSSATSTSTDTDTDDERARRRPAGDDGGDAAAPAARNAGEAFVDELGTLIDDFFGPVSAAPAEFARLHRESLATIGAPKADSDDMFVAVDNLHAFVTRAHAHSRALIGAEAMRAASESLTSAIEARGFADSDAYEYAEQLVDVAMT